MDGTGMDGLSPHLAGVWQCKAKSLLIRAIPEIRGSNCRFQGDLFMTWERPSNGDEDVASPFRARAVSKIENRWGQRRTSRSHLPVSSLGLDAGDKHVRSP